MNSSRAKKIIQRSVRMVHVRKGIIERSVRMIYVRKEII